MSSILVFSLILSCAIIVDLVIILVIKNRAFNQLQDEADFWRVRYISTLPTVEHESDAVAACKEQCYGDSKCCKC